MKSCQLCASVHTEVWNVPLLESSNFVVLPSLGALVQGWVLIVPKNHFLSTAALPDALIPEMLELKELVCGRLERTYGAVSAFEHGPSDGQRRVGCGVDHAHLHLVPVDFDLSVAVAPYLPTDSRWSTATSTDCREAVQSGYDYLYLEQPIGKGRMIRHRQLGSQVFRRAVATHLGVPEEYDWRNNPQIGNIEKTIQTFKEDAHSGSTGLSLSGRAA